MNSSPPEIHAYIKYADIRKGWVADTVEIYYVYNTGYKKLILKKHFRKGESVGKFISAFNIFSQPVDLVRRCNENGEWLEQNN
jgi:hypothetical protein